MTVDGMGGEWRTVTTTRLDFQSTVRKKTVDSWTFDTNYERLVTEVDAGVSKFRIDTNEPTGDGEPDTFADLRSLIDTNFTVTISDRNEVREITGLEAILDEIKGQMPDNPAVKALLKQSFNEDALKSMMQQAALIYPQGPVKVGDTWSTDVNMPGPAGNVRVKSSYRIEGEENKLGRNCVKIALATDLQIEAGGDIAAQFGQMFGSEAELDWKVGDSKGNGTIWVDLETGLVVVSELDQSIPMTMSVNLQGEALDMDMSINHSIGLELLD